MESDAPGAGLEPVAGGGGPAALPLLEVVEALRKELGLEGNTVEVLSQACEQLGIAEAKGLTLPEQAKRCWDALNAPGGPSELARLLETHGVQDIMKVTAALQVQGISGAGDLALLDGDLAAELDAEMKAAGVILGDRARLKRACAEAAARGAAGAAPALHEGGGDFDEGPPWEEGGPLLRKVPAGGGLHEKIQQMVDATYTDFYRRDMRHITKASRLKVEEVVHIQNTTSYRRYATRRKEVAGEFRALAPADRRNDWGVKTDKVFLDGVRTVDTSINECWLWHGISEAGAIAVADGGFQINRAARHPMYGHGVFFHENSCKADDYTREGGRGFFPLLLCRVVLGRVNYTDAVFPNGDDLEAACMGGGYHSVLADREKARGQPREFVVFDEGRVYPEFIVWYTRVH